MSQQRTLFDCTREAERALQYLQTLSMGEIARQLRAVALKICFVELTGFLHILTCMRACVYYVLVYCCLILHPAGVCAGMQSKALALELEALKHMLLKLRPDSDLDVVEVRGCPNVLHAASHVSLQSAVQQRIKRVEHLYATEVSLSAKLGESRAHLLAGLMEKGHVNITEVRIKGDALHFFHSTVAIRS